MGIDEFKSKHRGPSQKKAGKRNHFRSLLCEHLERREVMDAAGIFDQGTDPAYFDRMTQQLNNLNRQGGMGQNNGGGNNGGNGGGGQNLQGGGGINLSANRWTSPTGGPSPNLGDPATVKIGRAHV